MWGFHVWSSLCDVVLESFLVLQSSYSGRESWLLYFIFLLSCESKKDSKDQELIQSSTTPVPGYQMGK